jgi:hypothetical protein
MKRQNVLLFSAALALLSSCTMQKRYHNGGWQIEFRKGGNQHTSAPIQKSKPLTNLAEKAAATPATMPAESAEPVEASVINSTIAAPVEHQVAQETKTKQPRARTQKTPLKQATAAAPAVGHETVQFKGNTSQDVNKKNKSAADMTGDKNWILALVLCWFLGIIGIHRFYLGYTVIGIIQLLTLGGFGIWTLIDFIRIILKDLQPKNGSYSN